jgi:hypothetical protein
MYKLHATATALSAVLSFVAAGSATAQKVVKDGYLCCNLRVSGTWASDLNDPSSGGRVLPAGSKVVGLTYGSRHLDVEIGGEKISIGNDYSRTLTMEQFADRWIVAKDPTAGMRAWSARMRQAVKGGRLMKGMDRNQVLMSVGWPTARNTPNVEDPVWTFHASNGYTYKVVFDERWRVKAIDADGPTKAAVMMP